MQKYGYLMVPISPEGYRVLKAEALVQRRAEEDIISGLLLSHISEPAKRVLEIIDLELGIQPVLQAEAPENVEAITHALKEVIPPDESQKKHIGRKSKLTPKVKSKIIKLWNTGIRGKSRIAREVGVSPGTASKWIQKMIEEDLIQEGKVERALELEPAVIEGDLPTGGEEVHSAALEEDNQSSEDSMAIVESNKEKQEVILQV